MNSFIELANESVLLKLAIASTLSLIIGIERELKKKPVGLKTSLVIACFSCLLTIISIETAYSTPARPDINITMDPLRLAAQIVSGIGFLGAGVILRRGNDTITGLTTAAMIWGAAGIGIAVGAGFYSYAIFAVFIVFLGIEVIAPLVTKFGPKRLRRHEGSLVATVSSVECVIQLTNFLKQAEIQIEHMSIRDIQQQQTVVHEVHIRFSSNETENALTLYNALKSLSYVQLVSIEYI